MDIYNGKVLGRQGYFDERHLLSAGGIVLFLRVYPALRGAYIAPWLSLRT
ncbi:MAG: hypothetical protein QGG98_07155 [Pseudomonadales bacterium]|nr:hypothetical protein [Pseudomonadales bacterium]